MTAMQKTLGFVLLAGLVLAGCRMQLVNRLVNGDSPLASTEAQTMATASPTELPTNTPVPTATSTVAPTPDPRAVGLPAEPAGTTALDFVAAMCKADWFSRNGPLPCPGSDTQPDLGYVMRLPGDKQGLAPDFPVLLMYPPQARIETIFGRYPAFTVREGDRFRAVLACREHTFCDVEFAFEYYDANGKTGVAHWPYRFTDNPIVVDYSLDGMAGLTVQFGLALRGTGNRLEAYGVWILPHIYRPAS